MKKYSTRVLILGGAEGIVRISRTARFLGIESVSLFRGIVCADYSNSITTSTFKVSDFSPNSILHAIHTTKCDSVHPGYSTSIDIQLLKSLLDNKIAFFGPSPECLQLLYEDSQKLKKNTKNSKPKLETFFFNQTHIPIFARHQKNAFLISDPKNEHLSPSLKTHIAKTTSTLLAHTQFTGCGSMVFREEEGGVRLEKVNPFLSRSHAIVESLMGVDLVELQMRFSEIPSKKKDEEGCAIQTSLQAQYPQFPTAFHCHFPKGSKIRADEGFGEMSVLYDEVSSSSSSSSSSAFSSSSSSLSGEIILGSLTAVGKDVGEAKRRLCAALDEVYVSCLSTNVESIRKEVNMLYCEEENIETSTSQDTPSFSSPSSSPSSHPSSSPSSSPSSNPSSFPPSSPPPFSPVYEVDPCILICQYLSDVIVNGPKISFLFNSSSLEESNKIENFISPLDIKTNYSTEQLPNTTFRNILLSKGPEALIKEIRKTETTLITDTTMRDGQQCLLATRMRTRDMLDIASAYNHLNDPKDPSLFSLELWGGATFDVAYRILKECPWKRLELLREAIPSLCFQMLLRGSNALGYARYHEKTVEVFCEESALAGIDVFRVFDAMNDIENLKIGISASGKTGRLVEGAIVYAGGLTCDVDSSHHNDDHRVYYDLEYYMKFAEQLVRAGIHILCIKDMSGIMTPSETKLLIENLRGEYPDLPIHFHTHDTAGLGVASLIAASHAGADIVDTAMDPLSGTTSQPSFGAFIYSMGTKINQKTYQYINQHWDKVRSYYSQFDVANIFKSSSSHVFTHQIPGGQYSNLYSQAKSLNLTDNWYQVKNAYSQASALLGNPPKVTPTSKTVGDLALFMVANELSYDQVLAQASTITFPNSVVDYFKGGLGKHPFGFPEELKNEILKKYLCEEEKVVYKKEVDFFAKKDELRAKYGDHISMREVISFELFPEIYVSYEDFRKKYGDVYQLPTGIYFNGCKPGDEFEYEEIPISYIGIQSVSEFFAILTFNIGGRNISILTVRKNTGNHNNRFKKRVLAKPNTKQLPSPADGVFLKYKVSLGQKVQKDTPIALLSHGLGLETMIVAPASGIVKTLPFKMNDLITYGEMLIDFE